MKALLAGVAGAAVIFAASIGLIMLAAWLLATLIKVTT